MFSTWAGMIRDGEVSAVIAEARAELRSAKLEARPYAGIAAAIDLAASRPRQGCAALLQIAMSHAAANEVPRYERWHAGLLAGRGAEVRADVARELLDAAAAHLRAELCGEVVRILTRTEQEEEPRHGVA